MTGRQLTHAGLPVPYITAWSNERVLVPQMVLRQGSKGLCIGFADETPYDRDEDGVLWVRQGLARGVGEANFARVHALRQRRAVKHLLCEVCGADTTERDPDKWLFLLKDIRTEQGIVEGERTTASPLCPECALLASRACPEMRAGCVAAWVEKPLLWGVAGVPYDPVSLRPLPGDDTVMCAYEDPHVRWVLASRLVMELNGCTPVDLRDLDPDAHPLSART